MIIVIWNVLKQGKREKKVKDFKKEKLQNQGEDQESIIFQKFKEERIIRKEKLGKSVIVYRNVEQVGQVKD